MHGMMYDVYLLYNEVLDSLLLMFP